MRHRRAVALGLTLAAAGCANLRLGDRPIPPETEIVLAPGASLTATTPNGPITITAGQGRRRCYTFEGATRCVEMEPRRQRWLGSLGLYHAGFGHHWEPHNGVDRGVLEEGQQHFASEAEALAWIEKQRAGLPLSYRRDGLVVGWGKNRERQQLNVDVFQIYVAGAKPAELPGGHDAAIVVTPAKK